MKTSIILGVLLLFPFSALAQTSERDVSSQIKRVTVFKNGAQVTREANTTIPAGTTALIFVDLTPNLHAESIQLKAEGSFTVLSVVHRNNFFKDNRPSEEAERLRVAKEAREDTLKVERMMFEVYKQEEAMLVENKSIGGSQSGVQVEELKSAAAFFRERLTDIKAKRLEREKNIARLLKAIKVIDNQLNEIDADRQDRYTSEVTVTVTAERQVRGAFELSYLTDEAGWYPHYDLRVQDVDSPIALVYNANVFQSSGEDWDDVKLTLSTGNPALPGSIRTLRPWRVDFYVPSTYRRGRSAPSRAIPGARVSDPREVSGRVFDAATGEGIPGVNILIPDTNVGASTDLNGYYQLTLLPGSQTLEARFVGYQSISTSITSNRIDFALAPDFTGLDEIVVTGELRGVTNGKIQGGDDYSFRERNAEPLLVQPVVNTTTVEFEIALPYTVPSDGKPYAAQIETHDVPVTYEYYCAPKLDADAFLTARITGWEDYYLLSGSANLFFEGTFVGQSFLDVESVSDTLVVSLGRDKGIVVQRKKQADFTKRQFLGNKKTETFAFEIEVRNNKRQPIQIVIEDQIPLSTRDEIDVKSEPDHRADVDEETGILRWRLDLPPSAADTLAFQYSVKYPKKKRVVLE